jgi:hypothetical protein
MFKWLCLATGIIFLVVVGWMINDIRLQVHHSSQMVHEVGHTVNEHLPTIVEKSRTATETLAELAEDIRQLKELVGVSHTARDQNLVAYADSVLKSIEASGGTIGLKKSLGGSELKHALPAKEWAVGARKEAVYLTVVTKSKKELVTRLANNWLGTPWYIQLEGKEAVKLLDWLKAHHAATKELMSEKPT